MRHAYLYLNPADLETEYRQCTQEGREVRQVEEAFARLQATDENDRTWQAQAHALLDKTITLPLRPGYPYHEPSDLDGILLARPQNRPELPAWEGDEVALLEKVYGAWLGRCCGCLLGKPVEGWHSPRLWGFLRDSGQEPLSDYLSAEVPAEVQQRYDLPDWAPFKERVQAMPEDDDLNYTVTGLAVLKSHGREFTPEQVASFWLMNVPVLHTFTAERVAYRNFLLNLPPPHSATYRNPYREWIGAQIRADFWGYACPGNPELAAELAHRDACISHVKNGIYGAMWVAAMLAAAYVASDVQTVLNTGLGELPANCRLAESVRRVMTWHDSGVEYQEAIRRIHEEWDETRAHDWCHTISNAMLVACGLLWGEGDYERSITRAVYGCFDTDCNGATTGSIIGLMHGASALPAKWTSILNDTLHTGLAGYHEGKISDLAQESVGLIHPSTGNNSPSNG
jgi:ADP-ribosylglycohydrolase